VFDAAACIRSRVKQRQQRQQRQRRQRYLVGEQQEQPHKPEQETSLLRLGMC
jgi:hypothetical protein